jgi:hypothetical protein
MSLILTVTFVSAFGAGSSYSHNQVGLLLRYVTQGDVENLAAVVRSIIMVSSFSHRLFVRY